MRDMLGTVKWQLNTNEVGYMVGKDTMVQSAKKFKMYIPNIMPLIEQAEAETKKIPIMGSCFINAGDCSVPIMRTVTSANYIDVKTVDNMTFRRPVMKYGTEMTIGNKGDSVDQLYITNITDASAYSKSKEVNESYRTHISSSLGLN